MENSASLLWIQSRHALCRRARQLKANSAHALSLTNLQKLEYTASCLHLHIHALTLLLEAVQDNIHF